MKIKNKIKLLRKTVIALSIFSLLIVILFSCNVLWKSPPYYSVKNNKLLENEIMNMEMYQKIAGTHRRPYCYSINSVSGGSVFIVGVEHVTNRNHSQFDTIQKLWNESEPTVALIEGRLGFLFTWFQDPVTEYRESGFVSELAKMNNVELYTWEPTRDDEIEILMKQFSAEQIALFYSFRPYFSNMRNGKPENPEMRFQEYLKSRTDYEHIRNIYQSWEELDSIWNLDYPNISWRDYSDEQGWPKGYLHEIWNESNLARDFHLIQVISELVENGESVFVTMGVSHAPRIEIALRSMIKSNN